MIPYGHQSIDASDIEAVSAVLAGDWLTTGPAVGGFEAALSRFTDGTPCVSVTSGTAALHCAYHMVGVSPGDEVITPPLTFVATQATAIALGARIVFADVQSDTGNVDPAHVESLITPKTKAIVAVDYAGHPADLDELRSIAARHGIALVEDAAHAIGSTYRDRAVGSISDVTTFSFFPTKNMTTGEGGAVAAADPRLLDRGRKFRNHGLVRDSEDLRSSDVGPWHQEVQEFGLNYRLPDILAALGTSQLERLPEFKRRRAEIFRLYEVALAGLDLTLPTWRPYVDPTWHLFPIRVPSDYRRQIFESLRHQGIGVQVNYLPAYLHPAFAELGYSKGLCPNAEKYYDCEISLPMFVDLSEDQIAMIAGAVKVAFDEAAGH